MRRTIATLTVVAVAAALAACSSGGAGTGGGGGGIQVVTSTDVYGDLVRDIGGNAVDVTSIIDNPSADPHSYEASARTQLAVSKADVVVENGGGYDDFMDRLLSSSDSDATVVNVVKVSGHKAVDGELNEHVWYDLAAVRKLVTRLVAVLSKASADDAKTFRANGARLDRTLAGLQRTEAQIATKHRGAKVAITEPVPLYMLQACGLVNRTPEKFSEGVEEGEDVPVAVVQQTVELFSKHQVAMLALNTQTEGTITDTVEKAARSNNVPVVGFTETLPKGSNFVSWMRSNLKRIDAALA